MSAVYSSLPDTRRTVRTVRTVPCASPQRVGSAQAAPERKNAVAGAPFS
jgi:hypothetical protein